MPINDCKYRSATTKSTQSFWCFLKKKMIDVKEADKECICKVKQDCHKEEEGN
jgi:hypothetical protein